MEGRNQVESHDAGSLEDHLRERKSTRDHRGAFETRREKAFAVICLSLSSKCRDCLQDKDDEDPVEAWRSVERRFNRGTPEVKAVVLRNLLRLSSASDWIDLPMDYVSRFNELVSSLTMFKVEIGDEMLVAILLNGLPASYEQFTVVVMMRQEGYNLEQVLTLLNNEICNATFRGKKENTKQEVSSAESKERTDLLEMWKDWPNQERLPRERR